MQKGRSNLKKSGMNFATSWANHRSRFRTFRFYRTANACPHVFTKDLLRAGLLFLLKDLAVQTSVVADREAVGFGVNC